MKRAVRHILKESVLLFLQKRSKFTHSMLQMAAYVLAVGGAVYSLQLTSQIPQGFGMLTAAHALFSFGSLVEIEPIISMEEKEEKYTFVPCFLSSHQHSAAHNSKQLLLIYQLALWETPNSVSSGQIISHLVIKWRQREEFPGNKNKLFQKEREIQEVLGLSWDLIFLHYLLLLSQCLF